MSSPLKLACKDRESFRIDTPSRSQRAPTRLWLLTQQPHRAPSPHAADSLWPFDLHIRRNVELHNLKDLCILIILMWSCPHIYNIEMICPILVHANSCNMRELTDDLTASVHSDDISAHIHKRTHNPGNTKGPGGKCCYLRVINVHAAHATSQLIDRKLRHVLEMVCQPGTMARLARLGGILGDS